MARHRARAAVLSILLVLFVSPWLLAQEETEASPEYAPPDSCLLCHGADATYPAAGIMQTVHAISADERTPFADGNHGCQACHGPSADHLSMGPDGNRPLPAVVFDRRMGADEQNRQCLDCHARDTANHWAGSGHEAAEVACSDCHRLHSNHDPVRSADTQNEVCFDCHRRERADFFRNSVHPVREGLLACTDCHQPHGSAGPALLHAVTLNQTCYECHAEKRGPFLWEHAPVQEDCSNCHVPHGSNYEPLLVSRTPWLCQQCHLARFHPSTALSGTGSPPQGASQNLLSRNCMNCHVNVHGSNHPSGARLIR